MSHARGLLVPVFHDRWIMHLLHVSHCRARWKKVVSKKVFRLTVCRFNDCPIKVRQQSRKWENLCLGILRHGGFPFPYQLRGHYFTISLDQKKPENYRVEMWQKLWWDSSGYLIDFLAPVWSKIFFFFSIHTHIFYILSIICSPN